MYRSRDGGSTLIARVSFPRPVCTLPWRGRVGEQRSCEPGWGEWPRTSPHPDAHFRSRRPSPSRGGCRSAWHELHINLTRGLCRSHSGRKFAAVAAQTGAPTKSHPPASAAEVRLRLTARGHLPTGRRRPHRRGRRTWVPIRVTGRSAGRSIGRKQTRRSRGSHLGGARYGGPKWPRRSGHTGRKPPAGRRGEKAPGAFRGGNRPLRVRAALLGCKAGEGRAEEAGGWVRGLWPQSQHFPSPAPSFPSS